MSIRDLESKGVLQILIAMLGIDDHSMIVSQIRALPDIGQGAAYTAINILKELQLIEELPSKRYNARVFKLTEKGMKLAKLLKEIDLLLKTD